MGNDAKQNMKVVNLTVVCDYNYRNNIADWVYILEYKGAISAYKGSVVTDSKLNGYYVAILNAQVRLTQQVKVVVRCKDDLYLHRIKLCKGNKEMLMTIVINFINSGCLYKQVKEVDASLIERVKCHWVKNDYKIKNKMADSLKNEHLSDSKTNTKLSYGELYGDLLTDRDTVWAPGSGGY